MKEAIFHFPTDGAPVSCEQIKSGHINETYLITTDNGTRYILQWINRYVFPNVNALMNNMAAISAYLAKREKGKMAMIRYIDTLDGHSYYDDGHGGCRRGQRPDDDAAYDGRRNHAARAARPERGAGGEDVRRYA